MLKVSDLTRGSELIGATGIATWIAHFVAEMLGENVREQTAIDRRMVTSAALDGLPIIGATVLPACAVWLGRVDVISDGAAKTLALVIALAQLFVIGAVVARITPTRGAWWLTACFTLVFGVGAVLLRAFVKH